MCETFNRAILEHRDKSIITLLEGIKHYITKRITKQKNLLQGYDGIINPRFQLVIEKNKKHAQGWTPTWHGNDDLSIFGATNGIETYYINLKNETCSCRKCDLSGIPCCHVITCIWNIKKQPENYVVEYYRYTSDFEFFNYVLVCIVCIIEFVYDFFRKLTFQKIYSNIVFPTNEPELWPIIDHVPIYPLVMRQSIGSPKKLRNKENDDPKNPHVLSRRLATITCKKCG